MNGNSFPKISIITPSYNQGQYIEQTITSILDQNYPNLEYIIIDGGSIDNTIDIIKKYEKYLTYWISEKDKGQSDAINKGVRRATGEIVNWLNSDDYYMPGTLHHVASVFSDPHITAYCGCSRIFSNAKEYISQGTDIYSKNLPKTIGWARIDQPETFFRKKIWDVIGCVNEGFHYVMDKELWIRYLLKYGLTGIVKDDKILVNFRIHDNSKTSSQQERFQQETFELFYSLAEENRLEIAEAIPALRKVNKKNLFGYNEVNKELLEAAVNYFLLHVALENYAKNEYSFAKKSASLINMKFIKQEDWNELQKVLFRMRLLPKFLKKSINKVFR